MKKELKVAKYNRKQKLLDAVNANSDNIEVISITSSQSNGSYKHFVWYYELKK